MAVITWKGTVSNDWHNGANWDLNRIPNATDDVLFDPGTNPPNPPKLFQDATVLTIEALPNFNQIFEVFDAKLVVGDGTGQAKDWKGSRIRVLKSGGILAFNGFALTFYKDGISGATGGGTADPGAVFLYNGGAINFRADADLLGVTANIGAEPGGPNTPGAMTLQEMNQNLTVYNNRNIVITGRGTLELGQNAGSATKGDIVREAGSQTSTIVNGGTIKRTGDTAAVVLDIHVINDGTIDIQATRMLKILPAGETLSLLNKGSLELKQGAKFICTQVRCTQGGSVTTFVHPTNQLAEANIEGNVTLDDGASLNLGDDETARRYSRLHVTGNFSITSLEVRLRIDGADGALRDRLTVTGTATFNGSEADDLKLAMNVLGAVPPANRTWVIISAGTEIAGPMFEVYSPQGQLPASGFNFFKQDQNRNFVAKVNP